MNDATAQKIFDKLEEHTILLTSLNIAINGNGTRGINDRLKIVERVVLGLVILFCCFVGPKAIAIIKSVI